MLDLPVFSMNLRRRWSSKSVAEIKFRTLSVPANDSARESARFHVNWLKTIWPKVFWQKDIWLRDICQLAMEQPCKQLFEYQHLFLLRDNW